MRKYRILPLLAAVILLISIFAFSGVASAATVTSAIQKGQPDFSTQLTALQKACRVVTVSLNGATHTAVCTQSRQTAVVSPNSYRTPCGWNNEMIIWNYGYSGELCFMGGGYLGVAIYQVDEVDNTQSLYT